MSTSGMSVGLSHVWLTCTHVGVNNFQGFLKLAACLFTVGRDLSLTLVYKRLAGDRACTQAQVLFPVYVSLMLQCVRCVVAVCQGVSR